MNSRTIEVIRKKLAFLKAVSRYLASSRKAGNRR